MYILPPSQKWAEFGEIALLMMRQCRRRNDQHQTVPSRQEVNQISIVIFQSPHIPESERRGREGGDIKDLRRCRLCQLFRPKYRGTIVITLRPQPGWVTEERKRFSNLLLWHNKWLAYRTRIWFYLLPPLVKKCTLHGRLETKSWPCRRR